MSGTVIFLARQAMIAIGLMVAFLGSATKSVIPVEVFDRRIGKDGAVYFGAMDSGGRQRVVMVPIV